MNTKLPKLSREQWNFLSLLHAFREPVPIEIAGKLSPIPPGEFLELLGLDSRTQYILKMDREKYVIAPEWLPKLDKYLKKINTPEKFYKIVDQLYSDHLIDQIGFTAVENLISEIDPANSPAEIEINIAQMALKKKDENSAIRFLKSVVRRVTPGSDNSEYNRYFLRAVIMLAPLWFFSEGNFKEMISYIKKALRASDTLGDKRSYTVLLLHLSYYYQLIGKEEKSWSVFSKGYQGVKDLGDNDILSQTASLLTTNFILQGLYRQAQNHFEEILPPITIEETDEMQPFEKTKNIFLYGSCLIFLGEFVEAIGFLNFCWKRAREESDKYGELFAKNVLGVALLIIKHIEPAKEILQSALVEAKHTEYAFIRYLLQFNLSYAYYIEGDIKKTVEMILKASAIGEGLGTIRFPMAGYIMEMLFDLSQLGNLSDPRFNYKDQIEQILGGKNVDLKGTAMRLEALAIKQDKKNWNRIEKYLVLSEKYLEQSGNKIQLGKTYLELARFNLKKNENERATRFFEKANHCFGEHTSVFIPENSEQNPIHRGKSDNEKDIYNKQFNKIIDAYDVISRCDSKKDIFLICLKSICKISGGERAGLFRFQKNKTFKETCDPLLYNITKKELKSSGFNKSRARIIDVLKSGKNCIQKNISKGNKKHYLSIRSRCFLPIEINNGEWCVLYLDNVFIENLYDDIEVLWISRLIRKAESRHRQLSTGAQISGSVEWAPHEETVHQNRNFDNMKTENPAMISLIAKADKIASTESTVLITGETGTGKEVLAQRIHSQSTRREKHFVVVDLTAIPETLLESELFGHEKGAFTGADRQKIGRVELAHGGTLFLDEIGEIPLSFQVKLLRLLQEKKITRIGGAKTIPIDFRLIAATNKKLEDEVAEGRFRQDLYYRLNVVPISLPPLRERQNDIIVLARHFLTEFEKQHNKPNIHLTPEDKTWLMTYHWPGNIRELKNIIERNVILSTNGFLNLPIAHTQAVSPPQVFQGTNYSPAQPAGNYIPVDDFPSLDEVQRRYIKMVLDKTNGKITGSGGAVHIIDMKPSSLYNRMKKLGIR